MKCVQYSRLRPGMTGYHAPRTIERATETTPFEAVYDTRDTRNLEELSYDELPQRAGGKWVRTIKRLPHFNVTTGETHSLLTLTWHFVPDGPWNNHGQINQR